jgi:hypothetical protein
VNWAAIESYLRATRGAARLGAEPAPQAQCLKVDELAVRAFRARSMHLDQRLKAGTLEHAAYAGLQDSAPRSALLSLHARACDVNPASWEHESLAQIWFRLGADYVVPRADLGVFTVGTLPRNADQIKALNDLGEIIVRALDGNAMRTRDLEVLLPDLPNKFLIRAANVTGRINIRWDARTTEVIPVDVPEIDLEDARRELVRRFLHWMGPASPAHFARWAAVPKRDALETWSAIEGELVPVDFEGRARWILAADEPVLCAAEPPKAVSLLPLGDPYLYLDQPPVPRLPEVGPDVSQRLVNSLGGRILVDGEIVGAWGRVQANVTLFPWIHIDRDRVEAEAQTFAGPMGRDIRVRWLP